MGAKVVQNERKTKLMDDFLLKRVKMSLSADTITEQSHADALPIATPHEEWIACRDEVITIQTVEKLMTILLTIIQDTQIDF